MSLNFSRRQILSTGIAALGGTLATAAIAADADKSAKSSKPAARNPLSVEELGLLLEAMGLKATQFESSFSFTFPFKAEAEWNMTMSATMSTDARGVWITAYLADLPQAAADVPRTALLKLLAQNDELGDGIFFAYIPKVRKIVLQRVIYNDGITSVIFKEAVRELATRVVETQQLWTVSEWKQSTTPSGKDASGDEKSTERPVSTTGSKDSRAVKAASNDGSSAKKQK
jgi:hypothetical protein